MQKIFLTTAILCVASFGVITGQTRTTMATTQVATENKTASFGVKANANMSNFMLRNVIGVTSNMGMGFSTGFFVKLESDKLALQTELLLQHRTSSLKVLILNTDYKYWGLELPVYLMGQVAIGSGKFFIGAGPYAGYGLDATISPGNFDLYNDYDIRILGIDLFKGTVMKRWDFGLGAIAGYELDGGFIINVSYQAGFVDLQHAVSSLMNMKNQTVSFGLGYKF